MASNMNLAKARDLVNTHLDKMSQHLQHHVNKPLHSNPETAYQEFFAHKTLTDFLEAQGFNVKRSTYGLETSFEAVFGAGSREVVFCAEYDALPEIGHACGHSLIATSSVAAFMGAAYAMANLNIPGRLRILGTPAEEGGGGKAKLIEAGAFHPVEDIAAAIMAHPTVSDRVSEPGATGLAEAGASAVGCTFNYIFTPTYKNVRPNRTLCETYVEDMAAFGEKVLLSAKPFNASTDMGNVSYVVPSFHGNFVIPTPPNTSLHNIAFAEAAGSDGAHHSAIQSGKGMAMLAVRVLLDDRISAAAKADFEVSEDPW